MAQSPFSLETQQQAAAFDALGETYSTVFGDNPSQKAAVEWLIQHLPSQSRVLDIGSGTGEPTAKLLAEAGHQVMGIDISTEMIRIAQQKVPHAQFHLMDVANLQLGTEQFQAVTAFFSLLMLRRATIATVLKTLSTCLQPPGYLLISMVEGDFDYIPVPFLGQIIQVSAYPRDRFTTVLEEARFKVLDLQVVDFHPGEAASPEQQLFYFCQYQQ